MKLSFRNNSSILHYYLYWNVSYPHHSHFSPRKGAASLQGGNEILCLLKITSSVNLDDKVWGPARPQGKVSPQFPDKWFSVWQSSNFDYTSKNEIANSCFEACKLPLSVCMVWEIWQIQTVARRIESNGPYAVQPHHCKTGLCLHTHMNMYLGIL